MSRLPLQAGMGLGVEGCGSVLGTAAARIESGRRAHPGGHCG
jgi:hypothetical protein